MLAKISVYVCGVIVVLLMVVACTKHDSPLGVQEQNLAGSPKVFMETSSAPTLEQDVLEVKCREFLKYLDRSNRLRKSSRFYAERLGNVGAKILPSNQELSIDLKVYDADKVEIYSPGHRAIRLTTATMDLFSDNELTALLAQQMARIDLGQSRRRFEVAFDIVPHAGLAKKALSPQQLLSLEQVFFRTGYSPAQLEKSDRYAAKVLESKGLSAAALGSALRKVAALPASSRYAMTHPDAKRRSQRWGDVLVKVSSISKAPASVTEGKTSTLVRKAVVNPKPSSQKIGKASTLKKSLKISPGWYVQVESLESLAEANSKKSRLHEAGYQTVLQRAMVKGVMYFRVLAGPYTTSRMAIDHKATIGGLGISDAMPFIKQIK